MDEPIVWLQGHGQRLGLVPQLGGGVAAWRWRGVAGEAPGAAEPGIDLWRPWNGASEDRYTLASFAMLPWANRISGGGFEHRGHVHAIAPNRDGEPYPIHGDGWLQPWALTQHGAAGATLTLSSRHAAGNPYDYEAEQRFELVAGGLEQSLQVMHRGEEPLPYGLGLHPWFPRTPGTRLQARVRGVWLAGADPIPTAHAPSLAGQPADWDLAAGVPVHGSFVDHTFTGWDGQARITWPEHGLALGLEVVSIDTPRGTLPPSLCLLYRPAEGPAFCFEPVTQPIDAFHLPGQPGLVELRRGQTLRLRVRWRVMSAPPAGGV